ncbi:WG repeat-containing protein [Myxococcus sp. AM009]|uniref:WG repeat-containing protein n=1 Tax=unclassified Myxococcus TaxID=2648731 RepID=UPI00159574C9|nr:MULTISPECIES: WG repeat-containing protein [unclassified Myxococcus]NVI98849.1 WG repeat-containing protein [Myxococcus sp. AM009]NVJ15522.1 WG repeat-containing protein [Myxococcus sp. AM010]
MPATRYGFIDTKGELVIPSPHGTPFSFNEGWARMPAEKGWVFINVKGQPKLQVKRAFTGFCDGLALTDEGFIDETGELVLPVAFKANFTKYVVAGATYVNVGRFGAGLAPVMRTGAKGSDAYINRKGEVVLDGFAGGLAREFVNGKAHVVLKDRPKTEQSRLIDPKGECLVSFGFKTMGRFSDGLALVVESGKFGFVDESGAWVLEPTLSPWGDTYLSECVFREGLAPVKVKGRYGFIDRTGAVVIEPRFQAVIGTFSEGLAVVKQDDLFGYVRSDGSWAIPPRFASAQPFSHGLAVVLNG